MKDISGRELEPGNIVVYANRLSRTPVIHYGIYKGKDEDGLAIIRGVSEWAAQDYRLNSKDGHVLNRMRMLAIPDECVPPRVIELLEEHYENTPD